MDGWTDRRMDGQMNNWVGGWIDRRIDGQTDRETESKLSIPPMYIFSLKAICDLTQIVAIVCS